MDSSPNGRGIIPNSSGILGNCWAKDSPPLLPKGKNNFPLSGIGAHGHSAPTTPQAGPQLNQRAPFAQEHLNIERINIIQNSLDRQTSVQSYLDIRTAKINFEPITAHINALPMGTLVEGPKLHEDPVVTGLYDELVKKGPKDIYNFLIDTLRFADGRSVHAESDSSSVRLGGANLMQSAIDYSNTPDSKKRILLAHGLFQKDAKDGFKLLGNVRHFLTCSQETSIKDLVQELDSVVEALRPITVLYKIETTNKKELTKLLVNRLENSSALVEDDLTRLIDDRYLILTILENQATLPAEKFKNYLTDLIEQLNEEGLKETEGQCIPRWRLKDTDDSSSKLKLFCEWKSCQIVDDYLNRNLDDSLDLNNNPRILPYGQLSYIKSFKKDTDLIQFKEELKRKENYWFLKDEFYEYFFNSSELQTNSYRTTLLQTLVPIPPPPPLEQFVLDSKLVPKGDM